MTVDGVSYEVDPDLAEETVILWWGLFDSELYVEFREKRYGPYLPIGGPIPLGRYRTFKKTKQQQRHEEIEKLSKQIQLPRALLENHPEMGSLVSLEHPELPKVAFVDPDPFTELTFPDRISAKLAIAAELCKPLAKLTKEQQDFINQTVADTLNKRQIFDQVHAYFNPTSIGGQHA